MPSHRPESAGSRSAADAWGFDLGRLDYRFEPEDELETDDMPDIQLHRRRPGKRELRRALGRETVAEILPELPGEGESIHVVGNGRFDYWLLVPHLLQLLGPPAAAHLSTWVLNRENALELLALLDAGDLASVVMLTGLYFKRRETSVYATLVEGLQERGQRFLAFENHAKVVVLTRPDGDAVVVEGSANFTANPRVEQYVITRDRALARFHVEWMEGML